VIDLTGITEAEKVTEAQKLAKRESLVPFDLEKGPLFRAVLLRLSEEDHVLVFNMHHIVSDGWSRGVLNAEIEALYGAFAAGKASPLAELAIQYAEYAVWQREWLKGEVLEKQLAYWRAQLRGAPAVLQLPFDRARPAVQSFEGAVHTVTLSAGQVSEFRRWSRGQGATLFMTLAACFQLLLSRYSGQQQIVVGTDLANRTSVELERLIGFFVNVLPLRTDLSGDPTFRELVGRVRETALGAYGHQEMPFDKLVEELSPERTLSHNPLVQVLFVMHNTPHREIALPGVRTMAFEMETTKSKFDIAVFVQESGDELTMEWLYSTDLFEAQTMVRMAAHYTTLLGTAVANPEARISTLDYLTAKERAEQEAEKREHQSLKTSQLRGAKRKTVSI
jgi:hypothetical protein